MPGERSVHISLLITLSPSTIVLFKFSTIVERKRDSHHHESSLSHILEVLSLNPIMPGDELSFCISFVTHSRERAMYGI